MARADRLEQIQIEELSRRVKGRELASELEFHAVWVVWLLAVTLVVIVVVPLGVLVWNTWPARGVEERGLTQLLQLWDLAVLKILLPLTTLILGYLFGSARRRGETG